MSDQHIAAELELLTTLMLEAKTQLGKSGLDVDAGTLYKLAFSAAEGGRKHEYFERKAEEAANKPRFQQKSNFKRYGQ
jgi:hypothetical protein